MAIAYGDRMQVDQASAQLQGVDYLHSPNQCARPAGKQPELVVIHGISLPAGQFGGDYVAQLFTNQLDTQGDSRFVELDGLAVSAHLYIRRDGHMTQFVAFDQCAWHAGRSRFGDRDNCNDFAIGIELEGTDHHPYEAVQYSQLESVLIALRKAYPKIERDRVVGHCHIAPGRKTDPGPAFDWQRLQRNLGLDLPVTQPQACEQ